MGGGVGWYRYVYVSKKKSRSTGVQKYVTPSLSIWRHLHGYKVTYFLCFSPLPLSLSNQVYTLLADKSTHTGAFRNRRTTANYASPRCCATRRRRRESRSTVPRRSAVLSRKSCATSARSRCTGHPVPAPHSRVGTPTTTSALSRSEGRLYRTSSRSSARAGSRVSLLWWFRRQ